VIGKRLAFVRYVFAAAVIGYALSFIAAREFMQISRGDSRGTVSAVVRGNCRVSHDRIAHVKCFAVAQRAPARCYRS